jgi:hypothetical protein
MFVVNVDAQGAITRNRYSGRWVSFQVNEAQRIVNALPDVVGPGLAAVPQADGSIQIVPDHRGEDWYAPDRTQVIVDRLGDPATFDPPLTREPRAETAAERKVREKAEAEAERDRLNQRVVSHYQLRMALAGAPASDGRSMLDRIEADAAVGALPLPIKLAIDSLDPVRRGHPAVVALAQHYELNEVGVDALFASAAQVPV